MKTQHNIGKEILAGLKEIQAWQCGKKKLKVTNLSVSDANSAAKDRKDKAPSFVGQKPILSVKEGF